MFIARMDAYQVTALSRTASKDEDDLRAGAAILQLVASVAKKLTSDKSVLERDSLPSGGQRGTEASEKRDSSKELHCQNEDRIDRW
jgi:hypothetical protein